MVGLAFKVLSRGPCTVFPVGIYSRDQPVLCALHSRTYLPYACCCAASRAVLHCDLNMLSTVELLNKVKISLTV